jgi:hypothetical protein
LVSIISVQWCLHKPGEMETTLNQEMIARRMSPEEIERVFEAGPNSACG